MSDDTTDAVMIDPVDEGFATAKQYLKVAVNHLITAGLDLSKSIELNVSYAHDLVTAWVIENGAQKEMPPIKIHLLATRLLSEVGQEAMHVIHKGYYASRSTPIEA